MKYSRHIKAFIALGIVFTLVGCGIYYLFFSMSRLPQGEFVCESTSPSGTYTVRIYNNSSALSSSGYRGEVTNNLTGRTRNIYWEYARNLSNRGRGGIRIEDISWADDHTVIIDGKVLDVRKDIYDWRRNTPPQRNSQLSSPNWSLSRFPDSVYDYSCCDTWGRCDSVTLGHWR